MQTLAHIHMGPLEIFSLQLRVGVGSPLAAEGLDDIDEAAVVLDAPLGTAGLLLLLFLGLHLGGLALHLAGTGKRAVHLEEEGIVPSNM